MEEFYLLKVYASSFPLSFFLIYKHDCGINVTTLIISYTYHEL